MVTEGTAAVRVAGKDQVVDWSSRGSNAQTAQLQNERDSCITLSVCPGTSVCVEPLGTLPSVPTFHLDFFVKTTP